MTDDYWAKRAEMGQRIRNLRADQRIIYQIFADTKDQELAAIGRAWVQGLNEKANQLHRELVSMDMDHKEGGGRGQWPR